MRQVSTAGVGSTFRALSVARTLNLWRPGLRFAYSLGEVQGSHAPFMCRHRNVEPASVERNLNVARRALVEAAGRAVMIVFGGVTSSATSMDLSAFSRPPVDMVANAA